MSGSWAWTSIGKPKSLGRSPLTSCQDSPPSSLRMTSQCFCMKSTLGRDGCIAIRCTQWPTSAVGSGSWNWDLRPRFAGHQVRPPSSVRASERAAELARLRFTSGVADFLQVLDAERTRLEAEDQLAQARTEATTAYAALYKALGGALPLGSAGPER